jgi:uncharacterized membrane protein
MLGITPFGMFHTVLSLIAVVAGVAALVRRQEIRLATRLGMIYFWFTVASCVTGLFIFHHGGFGKPHVLAIATMIVLALVYAAERRETFGRLSRYVAVIGFSLTLFFHMIPGFTETGTRLPVGEPLFSGPDDPALQKAVGVAFLVFLIGATLQALRIRSLRKLGPSAMRSTP